MPGRHPKPLPSPSGPPTEPASAAQVDAGTELRGFSPQVLRNIARLGWTQSTPIQAASIDPILSGRDVLGLARTGSGKTAAFLLPLGERLLRRSAAERVAASTSPASRRSKPRRARAPRVLVLCPTRELAIQVAADATDLFRGTPLVVGCVHGKVALGPQIAALAEGIDLVVATPGRAIDLLQASALRLPTLQAIVLDEADRMLDMGLGPQVRTILEATPPDRQTILFSATMPAGVEALAASILREPVRLEIDATGTVATHVAQRAFKVEDALKTPLLLALLGVAPTALGPADGARSPQAARTPAPASGSAGPDRTAAAARSTGGVLVFCRTRRRAHWVGAALARHGVPTGYLHGDRSQAQRTRALEAFRAGRFHVLLATDVAARGLHVESVRLVVQYDLPNDPLEHVHRIGRAAHGLEGRGGTGEAIMFVTPAELDRWEQIRALSAAPASFEPLPAALAGAEAPQRRGSAKGDGKIRRPGRADGPTGADRRRGGAAEENVRSRQSRPIGKGQRPGGGVRRIERPGSA